MKFAKKAELGRFVGTMIAAFTLATYQLGLSVMSFSIQHLMSGGFLMFTAIIKAWLRLATYCATVTPDGATPVPCSRRMNTGTTCILCTIEPSVRREVFARFS